MSLPSAVLRWWCCTALSISTMPVRSISSGTRFAADDRGVQGAVGEPRSQAAFHGVKNFGHSLHIGLKAAGVKNQFPAQARRVYRVYPTPFKEPAGNAMSKINADVFAICKAEYSDKARANRHSQGPSPRRSGGAYLRDQRDFWASIFRVAHRRKSGCSWRSGGCRRKVLFWRRS